MAKKKLHTIKVKEWLRVALVVILFVLLFMLLLRFDAIAEPVSKVTGVSVDKLKSWSIDWVPVIAAIGVITIGAMLFGLPWVAGLVIAVTVVAIAVTIRDSDQGLGSLR